MKCSQEENVIMEHEIKQPMESNLAGDDLQSVRSDSE